MESEEEKEGRHCVGPPITLRTTPIGPLEDKTQEPYYPAAMNGTQCVSEERSAWNRRTATTRITTAPSPSSGSSHPPPLPPPLPVFPPCIIRSQRAPDEVVSNRCSDTALNRCRGEGGHHRRRASVFSRSHLTIEAGAVREIWSPDRESRRSGLSSIRAVSHPMPSSCAGRQCLIRRW